MADELLVMSASEEDSRTDGSTLEASSLIQGVLCGSLLT